jgi:hypothetical protein
MTLPTKSTIDPQGFGSTIRTGGVHRTAAQQPTTFNAHPLASAALHFTFESAH